MKKLFSVVALASFGLAIGCNEPAHTSKPAVNNMTPPTTTKATTSAEPTTKAPEKTAEKTTKETEKTTKSTKKEGGN